MVSVAAFVFIVSYIVWRLISMTVGLRVSAKAERMGQDSAELGIEAYPEFVLMPEQFGEED